jgi:hypothetical protein
MTDLEQRLHESLTSVAHDAPVPDDLAGVARARLRRRRRARATVVAAVTVVVVAVPAALTWGGDSPDVDTAVEPGTPSRATTVPGGARMVTDEGLSLLVPDDWEPGARSDWCANGVDRPPGRPVVETSGMRHVDVGCLEPEESLGVTIASGPADGAAHESGEVWQYEHGTVPGPQLYLPGSWVGYWYDGDRFVSVNADDPGTVQHILDSIDTRWSTAEHDGVTVDLPPGWVELDQSGCRWPQPRFGPPDVDPCDPRAEGISLYGEATFDPASGPGLLEGDHGWSGYRYAGEYVVYVHALDRDVAGRILDSREPSR